MKGYITNIEAATLENENFRQGASIQLNIVS